jgi:hypothetical protein
MASAAHDEIRLHGDGGLPGHGGMSVTGSLIHHRHPRLFQRYPFVPPSLAAPSCWANIMALWVSVRAMVSAR